MAESKDPLWLLDNARRDSKVTKRLDRFVSAEDRFELQTFPCPITGCWIWCGTLNKKGYGTIYINGKPVRAHRYSWEKKFGPVPEGLVLDHFVCDNPRCVNPDHLRPVTTRENVLRGKSSAVAYLARDVCDRCGGEFSRRYDNKGRMCMICKRSAGREWMRAKRKRLRTGLQNDR